MTESNTVSDVFFSVICVLMDTCGGLKGNRVPKTCFP